MEGGSRCPVTEVIASLLLYAFFELPCLFILILHVSVLLTHLWVRCVPAWCSRIPGVDLSLVELELQTIVGCHVYVKNRPRVLCKSSMFFYLPSHLFSAFSSEFLMVFQSVNARITCFNCKFCHSLLHFHFPLWYIRHKASKTRIAK